MLIIVALLGTAALAYRVWTRMQAMGETIANLTDRVRRLEQSRAAVAPQRPSAPALPPVVRAPGTAGPPPVTPTPVQPTPATPPPVSPSAVTSPAVTRPAVTAPVGRVPVAPPALPRPVSSRLTLEVPSRDTLEVRIGSRWLLYVGVVAIVVGVSYFEKLAIDNHWISETARVVQGAILGLLLVGGGIEFVRKGYRLYGQILSGCGIAVLYVSTYAAFNFYHLIAQPSAFALMTGVTMLSGWLASRQRSQGLALVAVSGGFATPFLLPASTDAEVALFGYVTVLIGGTIFLERRFDWPTLTVVSYGFTVLTILAWASRFYTASKYLTTVLFLTVFCGMFLYILHAVRHPDRPSVRAERAILWTAPLAYYCASLVILFDHSSAFLVYILLLSLAGVVVSVRAGSKWRLAFWAAAAVPLHLWSAAHGNRAWVTAGLIAWTGVYVLNLAGLVEATVWRDAASFDASDIVLLHVNGLGAFAGAYLLLDPVRADVLGPLAAGLAVLNGALGYFSRTRRREEALHFAALGLALLTAAVALQLEGAWVTSAWAVEGALAAWLGLRERREWLRTGGLALFAVAVVRLVALQLSDPPVGQLLFLNQRAACGLFLTALAYALTFAHHRYGDSVRSRTQTGAGLVAAKLLLLGVAASEIGDYWVLHAPPPFEPAAQLIGASFIAGALIVWLGVRRKQEWVRGAGAAVVALAGFWLFSIQLEGAPSSYVPVVNGRAAAGLLAVLILYGLVIVHRRAVTAAADMAASIAVLTTSAGLLTLSLLTSEIDAFWAARGAAEVWSVAREGLQAIAWAGVGSFLVWLGLSNRRTWVRALGGVVLAVGVLRLLRLQSADAAPAYVVLTNARVMASLVTIALLYGLAHLYRETTDVEESAFAPAAVLWLAANVVTLTLLTSEITAYWHLQDFRHAAVSRAGHASDSHFAREMMLSITWAVYATLLVVAGLRRRYAPIRYFAMTIFVITIVKVFTIDLAELDRLYRVLSVIGLGMTLLLTSYLYQRISPDRGDPEPSGH